MSCNLYIIGFWQTQMHRYFCSDMWKIMMVHFVSSITSTRIFINPFIMLLSFSGNLACWGTFMGQNHRPPRYLVCSQGHVVIAVIMVMEYHSAHSSWLFSFILLSMILWFYLAVIQLCTNHDNLVGIIALVGEEMRFGRGIWCDFVHFTVTCTSEPDYMSLNTLKVLYNSIFCRFASLFSHCFEVWNEILSF